MKGMSYTTAQSVWSSALKSIPFTAITKELAYAMYDHLDLAWSVDNPEEEDE